MAKQGKGVLALAMTRSLSEGSHIVGETMTTRSKGKGKEVEAPAPAVIEEDPVAGPSEFPGSLEQGCGSYSYSVPTPFVPTFSAFGNTTGRVDNFFFEDLR